MTKLVHSWCCIGWGCIGWADPPHAILPTILKDTRISCLEYKVNWESDEA